MAPQSLEVASVVHICPSVCRPSDTPHVSDSTQPHLHIVWAPHLSDSTQPHLDTVWASRNAGKCIFLSCPYQDGQTEEYSEPTATPPSCTSCSTTIFGSSCPDGWGPKSIQQATLLVESYSCCAEMSLSSSSCCI